MTTLLIASQSASRRRLLADAGVPFQAVATDIDEDTEKKRLLALGHGPRELSDALAGAKAVGPSRADPAALVLGCDQTLALDDGALIDKCIDREEARDLLLGRLAGRRHHLHSAAVVIAAGTVIWRHVESVALDMRVLSAGFVDAYLDAEWDAVRWCVGCYRIEGPGAQLFSAIHGSLFAVQGLPLLPLLDFLRTRGVLAT